MADYQRIRPLFCDHLGLARSKYLPTAFASHGTKHCMALFSQHYDKQMSMDAPHAGFQIGMPDLDAVFDLADVRPGWDPGVGIVLADLCHDGELVPWAPRSVLHTAITGWEALGLTPMVGIELECYLLEPDGAGGWQAINTPGAMTYNVGPSVDPHGLLDEIMATADVCGFPLESAHSEYDAPQFEFTLHYDRALQAVDNIFLFKLMAQEIAFKRGLHVSFLGKPFSALTGSGLHINISATDEHGNNAFNDDTKPHGLSDVARRSIGGLLDHHEAMAAVCAPTVNAYKRLKPGQMSGVWANWGLDHRSVTVRVPRERDVATRLEYRLPDGSANPYIATAATLQAALLGIASGTEPPPIEAGDALETANTDRRTPANLSAALDALEADRDLVKALGTEFVDNFVAVKRDEWRKFDEAVTDWELRYYLPFI